MAAKLLGREYILIDNSREYCELASWRIKSIADELVFLPEPGAPDSRIAKNGDRQHRAISAARKPAARQSARI